MQAYRTILIDLDGTLVDSNDAHAGAWTEALRSAGYDASFSEVRERIGMGEPRLLRELCGLHQISPLARRIAAEHDHIFETQHLPYIQVMPGARDLLARIKHEGLTLVLTSAAGREQTLKTLEHAQLMTAFDHIVTSDEGNDGNPAPDPVLMALELARTPAPEALLVGDTPYDVAAARAAGVAVVALRSGGWPDHALRGAVAIYSDAVDLLTHFGMSPLTRFPGAEYDLSLAPQAAE